MIQTDDVAAWLTTQWNAAVSTATVTGGIWNGRPLETAAAPYAVFNVQRDGQAEYTSAGELPRFKANIAVFVDQATSTQAQGVEQAVGNAFPINYSGATASVRGGAGTVIMVEPRECSADTAFPMRAKSDVVACKMAFDVWIQSTTG